MNSKKIIFFLIAGILNLYPPIVHASEVDKGLVIIDNKPWKISWVKEEENSWALVACFEKGTLKTYFRKGPPNTGLGLSHENKPVSQEFEFYFGQKFASTTSEFEQWPDGAKAYAFKYEQKFERDGQKFQFGTTAIIEEVGDAENEIRYALYRVL